VAEVNESHGASMSTIPFFNPELSYDENYTKGPFGAFADGRVFEDATSPNQSFLGVPIHIPFGIPAGPLLNGKYVKAALDKGFDLPVYKTVRGSVHPCHPWPNVLAVHPEGNLPTEGDVTLVADHSFTQPIAITNSFGVPSFDPKIWQADLAEAVAHARQGQVVIGSFQGTKTAGGNVESYIQDFVTTAALLKETGVKVIEVNLSCPNEGTANVLCFDTERVVTIVKAIKKEIGNVPLLLKMAYFSNQERLEDFVKQVGPHAEGLAAINTIAAAVVDEKGEQALPGEGRLRSGVCGAPIKWAGLEMVERLVALRTKFKMDYAVIGVGGVTVPADYKEYRDRGADAVMAATGAMWNPNLAQDIKASL
jgi:dihydroorotate dehydrogenase (NAD+) catalytic subunit